MIETKIPEIRPFYEKLREIGDSLADTVDTGDLAQEILDFLAMAAGLKPVCLLGRGLDSSRWVAGAAGLAEAFGFLVVQGPFWDATPFGKFPGWYRDHTLAQLAPLRAMYVCSSRETAQEIKLINDADGRLSVGTEARLLGYPECCVVAHYDRVGRYHLAILSILKRLAGGDEAQMQTLLRSDNALLPMTQREIAHMEAALDLQPVSFGSWNQCPHCARNDDSPSAELSRQYSSLAETIDPELCQKLADRL